MVKSKIKRGTTWKEDMSLGEKMQAEQRKQGVEDVNRLKERTAEVSFFKQAVLSVLPSVIEKRSTLAFEEDYRDIAKTACLIAHAVVREVFGLDNK